MERIPQKEDLRFVRGGRGNGRVFRADQLNRQSDGM